MAGKTTNNLLIPLILTRFHKFTIVLFLALSGFAPVAYGQFTPGRLVVVQTTGSVSKGGSPVTLNEYTTSGTAGISVSIPATGSTPLQMAAGSGGSEGFLTRSTDGSFLVLAGYSTSATGISDITVTASSSTPRVIFKVDAAGTPTQVGSSAVNYSGNDIRGAVSDGNNFWASGASNAGVDGIDYYGPGTPTALGVSSKAYALQIFNGQIYFSTQKTVSGVTPNFGIYALGSGLPISGTITPTLMINTGTATPEDFSLNAATDICYIAINLNTPAGGIQKWTKSGGVWTLAYTLGTGATNIGAYGLVVDYSGTDPVIYATTNESTANRIIKITDTGSASVATTLVTGATNSWFHGIAFAPSCAVPAQPADFIAGTDTITPGQDSIAYTVPNDSTITYSWSYSGTGATIHGSGNSVLVDFSSSATNGILSVTAVNSCGASTARSMSLTMAGTIRITEYMYNGLGTGGIGEYVEFTNIGSTSVDMTGWSFDDISRTPGSQSLSAFGIVQPGESVILTELTAAVFRSNWNLCAPVKIIGGNTNGLGREDEINLYDASNTLVDRLTYGDQTFSPGSIRTTATSGWVNAAGIGANDITQWTLSAAADAEASFASSLAEIGSPGKSTRATVAFDPCFVANGAPTIVMNVSTTSNYLDGGVLVSPASSYGASGVINDPTDPAHLSGFDFTINDAETPADSLTVTFTSSDLNVVPTANILITGNGASRNMKITPTTIGYSNISLKVSDGTNTTSYVINYAASAASTTPALTLWHTGMSDGSDAIPLDDNYYISGDDELNVLNVYSRSSSGLPLGSYDYTSNLALPDPTKPEVDLEAATRSTITNNKIYWLGSMSNGKAPFDNKPNRNRLFATTITGTGATTAFTFAGYYGNLKATLLTWGDANGYNFTASAAAGVDSKTPSGFAAEGMVFGPDNTTLYIGLRAPLVPVASRINAVIAPIVNFETWFNNGTPVGNPTFGSPIELYLGGRGIRDLIRLSNGTYIIVAGSPGPEMTSALFKWTGHASDTPVIIPSTASGSLNMEGVMQVNVGGQLSLAKLQVISDGGDVVLYNDGAEAKDFADLNLRKFRSDLLNGVDLCFSTRRDTTATACNIFNWYGTNYTSSGNPIHTLTNATGCDSIVTLHLIIKNSTASVTNHTACNNYVWNGTTYDHSGTYSAHFTNTDGCDSTATLNLIISLPNAPSIIQNGSVLTSSAASGNQWYLNGAPITGATSQNYTATASGNYTVVITDVNGCSSTPSSPLHFVTTGLSTVGNQTNDIHIFPNPFHDQLNINYTLDHSAGLTIELIDLTGKQVALLLHETNATAGSHQLVFDALNGKLQNGLYLVRFTTATTSQLIKVNFIGE